MPICLLSPDTLLTPDSVLTPDGYVCTPDVPVVPVMPVPRPRPPELPPRTYALTDLLGCGRYSAQLWTRGGARLVYDRLKVDAVDWSRMLDDTSDASVSLPGLGRTADCFKAIRDAEPFEHELAISRSGVVVWQGPVTGTSSQGTGGTISAVDLSAWWDRRRLPVTREYDQVDAATIFEQLANDAMLLDPSPNLTVVASPSQVLATRKYLAGQHLMAGVTLRELAKTAIDWTIVGREVRCGGIVVPTDPIVLLRDAHLAESPQVRKDGKALTTRAGTRGAGGGDGDDPVFGEYEDIDASERYGLCDAVTSNTSILDDTSATASSRSTVELSSRPVTMLDTVKLNSLAPVTIDVLVPGAIVGCAFDQTAIVVAAAYRLKSVGVTASGKGEQVTLSLMPVGTGGDEGVSA